MTTESSPIEETEDEATDETTEPAEEGTPAPKRETPKQRKKRIDALKAMSAKEVEEKVPHYEQTKHVNDRPQNAGMCRVRVDGGDSTRPIGQRLYIDVRAGFGEGARVGNVRRRWVRQQQRVDTTQHQPTEGSVDNG